jgi:hypothetical protein
MARGAVASAAAYALDAHAVIAKYFHHTPAFDGLQLVGVSLAIRNDDPRHPTLLKSGLRLLRRRHVYGAPDTP